MAGKTVNLLETQRITGADVAPSDVAFESSNLRDRGTNANAIRVVHRLHTFLELTQNWIYPQIVSTPNAETRVYCAAVANRSLFPVSAERLCVEPTTRTATFSLARIINAVARRVGHDRGHAYRELRPWRPQLIHAHFGPRGWESLPLRRTLKVPLVTSFYGADAWMLPRSEPILLKRYTELFRCGDGFLVEGPAMRHRLVALGCPAEKIQIQRIGVDLRALSFERKFISNPLRVIMVGRFTEKKGLVDGLRACLLARSGGVELMVTIIGDTIEPDPAGSQIKEKLQQLAREPELSGRVTFTGFLPLKKTREIMRDHDVLLSPSTHANSGDAEGGSPIVLTEAMAMGLLCIGSRHCDIPEVILDDRTGYLLDEGDVTGIAALLRRLAQDPTAAVRLTAEGRRHVEENFALEKQLQKLSEVYRFWLTRNKAEIARQ